MKIISKLVLSTLLLASLYGDTNTTKELIDSNITIEEQDINLTNGVDINLSKKIDEDIFMYEEFDKIVRFKMINDFNNLDKDISNIYDEVSKYKDHKGLKLKIVGYSASEDKYIKHLEDKKFYINKLKKFFFKDSNVTSYMKSKDYAIKVATMLYNKGISLDKMQIEAKSGSDNYSTDATKEGKKLLERVSVSLYVPKYRKEVVIIPSDSDKDGVNDINDSCPETTEGMEVNEVGCPIDSDKDGVFDVMDDCPSTLEGVAVNINGCPFDEDSDGVYDIYDKCLQTKIGVEVDEVGCPYDFDKDGVFDYKDDCPATPEGLNVDNAGCPISKTLKLNFARYQSVIPKNSMNKVKEFAKFLQNNPIYKIEIVGHTDSRGDAYRNLVLSENRAKSTKAALVKFGVDASRISCVGLGELEPIATNATKEGRKMNRRIEIKLSY